MLDALARAIKSRVRNRFEPGYGSLKRPDEASELPFGIPRMALRQPRVLQPPPDRQSELARVALGKRGGRGHAYL